MLIYQYQSLLWMTKRNKSKSKTVTYSCTVSCKAWHIFSALTICDSPTHRMLKQKPCVTDLLTSWSGRLSNPTWPPKLRLRFSSFWDERQKRVLEAWGMWAEKHMATTLVRDRKTKFTFLCTSTSKTLVQSADGISISCICNELNIQSLQWGWA